jgi:hypothetical protein
MASEMVVVSSLADLEVAVRDFSSGEQRLPVQIRVERVGDLFEAYPLLRQIQKEIANSKGAWKVESASVAALLQASEYYQKLDLLELHLDLMRLDIVGGIAMKKIRFDGVRQTANDVVTHAHPDSTFEVLDNITIEGQRIARMANLLGFGGADVKDSNLMDDDLDWLLADGGEVVNFHEEQVGIPPEDKEAEVRFGPGEGVLGVGQQLEDCTLSENSLDELAYKRTMVGAT